MSILQPLREKAAWIALVVIEISAFSVVFGIWLLYKVFLYYQMSMASPAARVVAEANFQRGGFNLGSTLFQVFFIVLLIWVIAANMIARFLPTQALAVKNQIIKFRGTPKENAVTVSESKSIVSVAKEPVFDISGDKLYNQTLHYENLSARFRIAALLLLAVVPLIIVFGLAYILQTVLSLVLGFIVGTEIASFIWFVSGLALFVYGLYLLGKIVGLGNLNLKLSRMSKAGFITDDKQTPWALGARQHSSREEEKILAVLTQIQVLGHQDILAHNNWWVIDSPLPQAFTVGSDLYITSAAISQDDTTTNKYLTPILAHELGHLNNLDGLMLQALRNFVYPVVQVRMTNLSRLSSGVFSNKDEDTRTSADVADSLDKQGRTFFYSIIFGGLGAIIYASQWAEWFRQRDYLADDFVVKIGLGQELLEYLEEYRKYSFAVPFSASWSQYTELRIDRLL